MLEDTPVPELTDEEIVEIFSWVDPSNIPAEFIYLAKLVIPTGQVLYLDGHEYRDFVDSHPKGSFVGQVELALNLDRFGQDVREWTELVLNRENSDNDHFSFSGGDRS